MPGEASGVAKESKQFEQSLLAALLHLEQSENHCAQLKGSAALFDAKYPKSHTQVPVGEGEGEAFVAQQLVQSVLAGLLHPFQSEKHASQSMGGEPA